MSGTKDIVVVNVTSAPGVLGGAVLAAQWHSWYMAKLRPVSLWRMWDRTENVQLDALPIRNFLSWPFFGALGRLMPMMLQKVLLTSDIVKELKANPPAIMHIQNPGPSVEFERVVAQCKRQGTKVVASTHGFQECFDPHYGFDRLHERIGWDLLIKRPLRRAFKNVDAFLLGFPDQRELLSSLGVPDSKMFLVPNGIDPFFDQPASDAECDAVRQKFDLMGTDPILLFMGNHTVNKGLGTLMKVAETLEVPATVVVGGGLREGEPGKWLDNINLPPHVRVIFTDFLSIEDQRALYKLSHVFVFPSISETLPLVVLEAMAAGLPTVAFNAGGIGYELDEGAGLVAPLHDFETFRNSVHALLTDPDLHSRTAKASRQRQKQVFSWDLLAEKTIAVYDRLLAE